jgi:uncharacterized membrane protein
MGAFEKLGDMFSQIVENLRSPGRQKFDPMPRWIGGRIKIARPAQDVYEFWRAPGNLPKIFRVLQSVTIREGGITDWNLRGYTGQALAFSCEQVVEEPGRRIEWRALKDAAVHSTLNVTFTEVDAQMCELGVAWSLTLKADRTSEVPLSLDGMLDELTQHMLDDDLDRLRAVLNREGERLVREAEERERAEYAESVKAEFTESEEHHEALPAID